MKKRTFGTTGLQTTLLGFGGFHLLEIPQDTCTELLNAYLDAGGNYIETAAAYGNGASERKIGRAVSGRRDEYVLVTKTGGRTKDNCLHDLSQSLENLRTDHVDVLLMHGVATRAELDTILGPGGAVEGAEEAVADGRVGHIGLSMHGQPDVLIEALKRYPFAAVMTTINYYDRFNFPEIEDVLLPLARSRGAAVIIMKPLADGYLWKSPARAFRYAFSRHASVIVTGINHPDMLKKDLALAASYEPLSRMDAEEMAAYAPELGTYVCRQCGECLPCPEGIDIPTVFRLEGQYDRQMADGTVADTAEYALRERLKYWFGNRDMARAGYEKLPSEPTGVRNAAHACPAVRMGSTLWAN